MHILRRHEISKRTQCIPYPALVNDLLCRRCLYARDNVCWECWELFAGIPVWATCVTLHSKCRWYQMDGRVQVGPCDHVLLLCCLLLYTYIIPTHTQAPHNRSRINHNMNATSLYESVHVLQIYKYLAAISKECRQNAYAINKWSAICSLSPVHDGPWKPHQSSRPLSPRLTLQCQ